MVTQFLRTMAFHAGQKKSNAYIKTSNGQRLKIQIINTSRGQRRVLIEASNVKDTKYQFQKVKGEKFQNFNQRVKGLGHRISRLQKVKGKS